ncbi:MAG TPA: hypothetical protein VGL48_11030 [Acidimicrobiales bacterium]|jgi:hypothetical protein
MLNLAHASHTLVKTSAAGSGLHLSPMLWAVGSLAVVALMALVYVLVGFRVSYARRTQRVPLPVAPLPSEAVAAGTGPEPSVDY